MGNFTSHVPRLCTTGGVTVASITPAPTSAYYLVVPRGSDGAEGSYGTASHAVQRPPSTAACLPQHFAGCP